MADWMKMGLHVGHSVKILKARRGHPDAPVLYLHGILPQYWRHGRLTTRGPTIPSKHSDPDALGLLVAAFEIGSDELLEALEACQVAGLIDWQEDRAITLTGWDESWMPNCAGCKTPNPEPRFSRCPDCRGKPKAANNVRNICEQSANNVRKVCEENLLTREESAKLDRETERERDRQRDREPQNSDGVPPNLSSDSDLPLIESALTRGGIGQGAPAAKAKFQQINAAREFAAQGGTPEEAEALAAVALSNGRKPGALMAKLLKSESNWRQALENRQTLEEKSK